VSISPAGVLSVAPGAAGTFDVTIAATDGPGNSGQSVEQSFEIVITDAEVPPVIDTTTLDAAENQTLAGTVAATDGNGDPITFSIAGTGEDDALFDIDPATGELSFLSAPDFEVPQDTGADGVYAVDVTATANGQSVTQTVSVTVTDANDAPVEETPLGDQTATLGQPVVLPSVAGVFSDQDGDALTITASGLPDGVELIGTSFVGTPTETGSFTVTLEADDGTETATSSFTVEVGEDGPAASAKGYISVNAGATDLNSTSTFVPNSFLLRNDSTNGELITEVQIDLHESLLPYVGFDLGNDGDGIPYGDSGNKNFTVDGGTPTVTVTGTSVSEPTTKFPGTQKEGGFVTLTISLANFAPGDTLSFSLDQDPPSIKTGSPSSAAQAGAIAGVEQVGSTARFTFSDGSVRTADLFTDGSPAGAEAYADADVLAAPVLSVLGVTGLEGEVDSATQTVTITGGPANGQAKILVVDAGAFRITNDTPDNGYVFQEYEANKALAVQEILVTLDGNGAYSGQITLPQTPAPAGQVLDQNVVYLTAAIVGNRDADGNLEVTSLVSDKVSLKIVPDVDPGDPTTVEEVFAAQTDLDTSQEYGSGAIGAAVLTVNAGASDIDTSNFGSNSFQVQNVGDKKISAVFIDVTDALYPDSVFDPDGQAGDNVVAPWAIGNAGGTGAFVEGSGYFFPGPDPDGDTLPDGDNGGFKGALVKFNANTDGGFEFGEVVTFAGDMDPNSIAGLLKSAVDLNAILGWDVGGVSGHELIGSTFHVLFDDGSTASGQLASDDSTSGSQALASQGVVPQPVSLTVNGVAPGGTGTYGGVQPTVIIEGTPGDTVRVTLTKGFNPVTNPAVAPLVAERLSDDVFEANNVFDVQTVDIVIGPSGTFDASALFDFNATPANNMGSFLGDDVADIGFVASVIDPANGDLPIGPVTAPIYLTNQGGPVGNPGPLLTFQVLNGGTLVDGDLENGDSVNELALGDTPLFTGTLEQGEAGSVFLELLDAGGTVLDTQTENNAPFDLNYNGPAIGDGNYTLRATFYADDNLGGGVVGTQEIDFEVVDAGSVPTSFRIEAEDLTLESGFGVFSQGSFTLIRLPQNDPGGPSAVASTILGDVAPGSYSVQILAYNENDGEGEFQVTVGDDTFDFVALDASIGGNVGDSGQVGNRVLIDLGVIEIDEGDEFELVYNPIGNEVGRFDYIDFVAVDDPLQV
jgi:hypothetical protein